MLVHARPTHRQAQHTAISIVSPVPKVNQVTLPKIKRDKRPASLRTAHTGPHSRPKGNWQPAHNQPAQSLQDDLDKLVKWSEKWQMLFNFGKCKCIHIGHGNMDEEYKIGDAVLGRTTQEKGVTFSADMKVSEQCGIAASKGN